MSASPTARSAPRDAAVRALNDEARQKVDRLFDALSALHAAARALEESGFSVVSDAAIADKFGSHLPITKLHTSVSLTMTVKGEDKEAGQ